MPREWKLLRNVWENVWREQKLLKNSIIISREVDGKKAKLNGREKEDSYDGLFGC